MKTKSSNFYFFILSLSCFALFFFFSGGNRKDLLLKAAKEQIEQYLFEKENQLEILLHDSLLFRQLSNGNTAPDLINFLQQANFKILVYKNDSLIFWSGNDITVELDDLKKNQQPQIIKTSNGIYELITRHESDMLYAFLIPIKSDFPISNQYLQNVFSFGGISNQIKISFQPVFNSLFVKSGKSNTGLYIFIDENHSDIGFSSLAFFYCGIIFLIIFLYRYACKMLGAGGFVFLFFVLVCIRYIMVKFYFPKGLYDLSFYQPGFYAAKGVAGSLGDFIMNAAFVFVLSMFFYFRILLPEIKSNNRFIKLAASIFVYGIILLLSDWLIEIFKSLVLDSQIPFEINNIFSLNYLSIIGLFLLTVILFSYFFLTQKFFLFLKHTLSQDKPLHFYSFIISLALYFSITIDKISVFTVVFVGIYLLLSLETGFYKNNILELRFQKIILILSLFSSGLALLFNHLNEKKEKETRKIYAEKLSREADPIFEYQFNMFYNEMATDSIVKEFLLTKIPFGEKFNDSLNNYLSGKYFSGFIASKYDFSINAFTPTGYESEVMNADTFASVKFFLKNYNLHLLPAEAKETSNPYLYHYSLKQGLFDYFIIIPVFHQSSFAGIIYAKFSPQKNIHANVYPELLMDEQAKTFSLENRFEYAIYKNGKLIEQHGNYPYDLFFKKQQKENEEFLFESSAGYSHLIYQTSGAIDVIISEKESPWVKVLALFSHFFCLLLFFVFIFLLLCSLVINKFSFSTIFSFSNLKLKVKIQSAMIFTLIFSFFIIAYITIYNLQKHYETYHVDNLLNKINMLAAQLEQSVNHESVNEKDLRELEKEVRVLGNNHSSDINIFSRRGKLLASSQPEIFLKKLLSHQLHPEAYYQLTHRLQSVYFHHEKIGKLKFLSAYSPIKNKNGSVIAFLNLPYYSDESDLKNEISAFISLFININILFLLIAVLVAFLISKSITSPLILIEKRMKEVVLGKKNNPLEWEAGDEIGALVNEYNKMIFELEKSALALAKSEREMAWREMAKQVAHEIKNPLTTMRLRIQYLQKAFDDKAPNLSELTQKTSSMLIEQIDNLNNIATAFSSFAQMPKANAETVNLNELIKNVSELFAENEKNAKIEIQLPSEIIQIETDKNQLLQVINNLFKNAIQSIPEEKNGIIQVNLSSTDENIQIKINDNGSGIAEEQKEKIFLPSFTTKTSGMGLGLAISKNIIENMGGKISFESEENKGTTFFIEIPVQKNH